MKPTPRQVVWLVIIAVLCFWGTQLSSGWYFPLIGAHIKSFIPFISVPGELIPGNAWNILGFTHDPLSGLEVGLYNSLLTAWIAIAVIFVLAIIGRSAIQENGDNPDNFIGRAWESLVEYLYKNYMLPTLGARAKVVAPLAITAFVFIMVSAFFELLPGHESVGVTKAAPTPASGWCYVKTGSVVWLTGYKLGDPLCPSPVPTDQSAAVDGKLAAPADTVLEAGKGDPKNGVKIVPFLRRPVSDLSTTLALAIIAFVFIEIQGIRANGSHYFEKFLNFKNLKQGGLMKGFIGYIQFVVGFLELLSEFIRILSFAFRLFGNMFAGTILVFVMSFLIPMFLPTVFLALEFGVAIIQAFVFLMLITVFTSLAVESHH
jgi:F-type H+-transporting ATPase subunit a